ncbi:hypothetical protein ACE6H2_001150 [Prunus campanulata]
MACCCCFNYKKTEPAVTVVQDPLPLLPRKDPQPPATITKDPQPPPKYSVSPKPPKPTVVDPSGGITFNIHGNEISNNKADDVGLSHFGNKKNGGPNANNQDGCAHSAKQGGGDKLHFNLEGDSDKVCFNLEGNRIHGNQAKNVGFSEFGNA